MTKDKNSVTASVIKNLQSSGKQPLPKWMFVTKTTSFWLLFGLSVILGGISVSLIGYIIGTSDAYLIIGEHMDGALRAIPYFWLLFFASFIIIASWGLEHTPKGYKFTIQKVIGINIVASIVLGGVIYLVGATQIIDDTLETQAPFLSAMEHQRLLWERPEEGLLQGRLQSIMEDNSFDLEDIQGSLWRVHTNEDTVIMAPLRPGSPLRIKGELTGDQQFEADHILPGRLPKVGNNATRPQNPLRSKQQ